ncbi:MAG TPA: cell division protein SepF [Acidimicrobiales bacterium]|jgi:cell division inhibitor SepF|nr:cell division protein SepF [Acidimicrobiales bacterium]
MASFVNKALAYLGLKDLEDDELYDDYEPVEEARHAPHRSPRSAYPDPARPEAAETRSLVRPFVPEEAREAPGTRQAVVRPLAPSRPAAAKVHVVAPTRFADAQQIGDLVKASNPVIVNLTTSDRDLARRMIDFCSGLTYALGGSMEKAADQVFLLTPSNVEVTAEERQRLQEHGLLHS